jgi:hypothetical protein
VTTFDVDGRPRVVSGREVCRIHRHAAPDLRRHDHGPDPGHAKLAIATDLATA